MTAALADAKPETPTGVTGGFTTQLRRTVDISTAVMHLGLAASVRFVHDSDHPDLAELDRRGVTITSKGADRWMAAIDLVAEEISTLEGLPLEAAQAKVHTSWRKGHEHQVLWQAVAEGAVTLYQARTIEDHAERLGARIATLTEQVDADGNIVATTAEEGEKLLQGEVYSAAFTNYLTTAVAHAKAGFTGRKLGIRCSRKIRALTPGYETVVLEKPDDRHGLNTRPARTACRATWGSPLPPPLPCASWRTRTPPPIRPLTQPNVPDSTTPGLMASASPT